MDNLILQGVGLLLTALIGWVSMVLNKKYGMDIEARHREALHSALLSGARLAIAGKLTGSAAIAVNRKYTVEAAPDAVRAFKLDERLDKLDELAESKLEQLTGLEIDLPLDRIIPEDKLTSALRRAIGG